MPQESIRSLLIHAPADYLHGWRISHRRNRTDLVTNLGKIPLEIAGGIILPEAGASAGIVGPMEIESVIQHLFTNEHPYPAIVIPLGIIGGIIGLLAATAVTPQAMEGRHQRYFQEQNKSEIRNIE